jgi:hypothetical protein
MCEHLLRAMCSNLGSTDPVQRLAQRISLIISHDLEIYHIHPFATVEGLSSAKAYFWILSAAWRRTGTGSFRDPLRANVASNFSGKMQVVSATDKGIPSGYIVLG